MAFNLTNAKNDGEADNTDSGVPLISRATGSMQNQRKGNSNQVTSDAIKRRMMKNSKASQAVTDSRKNGDY